MWLGQYFKCDQNIQLKFTTPVFPLYIYEHMMQYFVILICMFWFWQHSCLYYYPIVCHNTGVVNFNWIFWSHLKYWPSHMSNNFISKLDKSYSVVDQKLNITSWPLHSMFDSLVRVRVMVFNANFNNISVIS
jgi:hypothetical protein